MSISAVPTQYRLPEILVDWPWFRLLSSHYPTVKAESAAWIESFRPFEPKEQRAFNRCDFNLLACLTYAPRSKEYLRSACDLMNFYFVYDEYTDVLDKDGATEIANIVMDALRNPTKPRPQFEPLIGEMARQLWERALLLVEPGSSCVEDFITEFENYVISVIQEAEDRLDSRLRTVEDYLHLRRETCGAKPSLVFIQFGLNLPRHAVSHPSIVALTAGATELVAITNDINSYTMEHARGLAGHNIITAAMYEHKLDLAGAFNWVDVYARKVVAQFLRDMETVPSWDEEKDLRVKEYIDGLGYGVRGHDSWGFESKRYYGDEGMKVQKTRLVALQPRTSGLAPVRAVL